MNGNVLPLHDLRPLGGQPTVPLPRYVQIEPVGQCNLRCAMCPIAYRPEAQPGTPAAFIDPALFRRLVDGFQGVEELQLQGLGEPLMHPAFFEMVRYAADKGIRVSTNTNLTLLTPTRARQCVASGLHTLHLSIDGATATTYESIRLGARFSKVLRNLDRLVAARTESGRQTPQLRVVCVAMRRNLHELADLVRLVHAHGVDTVFVQHLCHEYGEQDLPTAYRPMRDFVSTESLLTEHPDRVAQAFDDARRTADELGVELRLPPLTPDQPAQPRQRRCDWPWQGAYLSYRGDAMPCCMVSTPDRAQLGSMANDGVATVWNGPAYQRFRAALESGTPPDICRSCAVYNGTF